MASRFDTFVKSIVFPRPKTATYNTSTRPNQLLHIPRVDAITHQENGTYTYGYLITHAPCTHLMVYAHPNAVDIGMIYDELRNVSACARVSILLCEYTGYGLSSDVITEESINVDVISAYLFATRYLQVPSSRLIICGRSIGAAPAARLCAALPIHETPSLLILQCPFSSLSACVHHVSGSVVSIANYLGYNWFRTIDIIADVRCPVVLHHGTHDDIVPISHSYELKAMRDSAAHPCVTYLYQEDGKGHNNLGRTKLIEIIQEKVDTNDVDALNLLWPSLVVAHVPVYRHLFNDNMEILSMDTVTAYWNSELNLEDFISSRGTLYALLTASVCMFSARCAKAWQLHNYSCKKAAATQRIHAPTSKTVFIEWYMACIGSPLGVYVTTSPKSCNCEAVVFGCRVPVEDWGSLRTSFKFYDHRGEALVDIFELQATDALLKVIYRIISSAPNMMNDDDLSRVLHPDLVAMVQVECERLVAFMSQDNWENLQCLMSSFDTEYLARVSPKTYDLLQGNYSLNQVSDGAFEELQEWLRPWVESGGDEMSFIAKELPWEFYLYRGRSLLTPRMTEAEGSADGWQNILSGADVVLAIYRLFKKYSTQFVNVK